MYTGVERNDEISLIYVNLRKITLIYVNSRKKGKT